MRKPPCHHRSDLKELSVRKKCRRPLKVTFLLIRYRAQDGHFMLSKTGLISEISLCKEECPRGLLDKPYSPEEVCDCLQRFVAEARRGDGTPYLARTLYWILCGLLRHAREVLPNLPNFLDRKDVHFNPPTLVCCINAHYS